MPDPAPTEGGGGPLVSDLEKWQQEVVDLLTIMWATVRDHDCDDCRELYESTQARIDELVPPSAPAIDPPWRRPSE